LDFTHKKLTVWELFFTTDSKMLSQLHSGSWALADSRAGPAAASSAPSHGCKRPLGPGQGSGGCWQWQRPPALPAGSPWGSQRSRRRRTVQRWFWLSGCRACPAAPSERTRLGRWRWEEVRFTFWTGKHHAGGRWVERISPLCRTAFPSSARLTRRLAAWLHTEISCNFVLVQNLMLSLNM